MVVYRAKFGVYASNCKTVHCRENMPKSRAPLLSAGVRFPTPYC